MTKSKMRERIRALEAENTRLRAEVELEFGSGLRGKVQPELGRLPSLEPVDGFSVELVFAKN